MLQVVILSSLFILSVSANCNPDADGYIVPGDDDLPIPNDQCNIAIDENGWPVFFRHPTNCSRYWECDIDKTVCLFECPTCEYESLCPFGALYFDYEIQYPLGPVCDWPDNIECTNGWENITTKPPETTTAYSCPLPCQTVVNGECSPECCVDEDCAAGELCDSGVCRLGDCRTGQDCEGYTVECHKPWDDATENCEYCDNIDTEDTIGECTSGCENSNHDMCPAGLTCDGQHLCVSEGSTLLKKILLTTETCTNCDVNNESSRITVKGTMNECTTRQLDHSAVQDYSAGKTAIFESIEDVDAMGPCNNAEFAGGAKTGELSWEGAGTWTPSAVKLEVSGNYFYCCSPTGGFGPLITGATVSLTCVDC